VTEEFQKVLAAVGLKGHRGYSQCHPPAGILVPFLLGSSLLDLVSQWVLLLIRKCELLAIQLLEVYLLLFYRLKQCN